MRKSFLLLAMGFSVMGYDVSVSQAKDPPAATKKEEAHPETGPHKGQLIELGKEEYHLEFLHDEKTETISLWLLDSTGKKAVTTSAKQIVINVKVDKKAKQYKIDPKVEKGDPKDKFSCYFTKDKELIESLETKGAEAVVVIDVNGKQYRGKLEDEHGHEHEKK